MDPLELHLKSTDFRTMRQIFVEWLWEKRSRHDPEKVADDFIAYLEERTRRMHRLSEIPF